MTARTGYSGLQIGLHWIVAILIFGSYFTSEGMGRALEARLETGATGIAGNTTHVWLGGAIFALVALRVVVRRMQGAPAPADAAPGAVQIASVWGHRLIYLLMVLVPVSGAAAWYGGLGQAGEIHEVIGNALMIVALGHAVMAILHEAIWSDGTIARMVQPRRD